MLGAHEKGRQAWPGGLYQQKRNFQTLFSDVFFRHLIQAPDLNAEITIPRQSRGFSIL